MYRTHLAIRLHEARDVHGVEEAVRHVERGDFGGGGDDDDAAGRQPETAAMMRWSRRVLSHTGPHTTPLAW